MKAWRTETELSILEDYILLGEGDAGALIQLNSPPSFHDGVAAAAISSRAGVSLQWALKRYISDGQKRVSLPSLFQAYREVYFAGKDHIETTKARLRRGSEPHAGQVFAEMALRRLPATYFAAGLLFRIGHLFEARAVARVFLEQVAWALSVSDLRTFDAAAKVAPYKAIGKLKEVLPLVGPLYGELSKDTHLDLESHHRFMRVRDEHVEVLLAHGAASWTSGAVLLDLADCWSVVFERSQWPDLTALENWDTSPDGLTLNATRPFAAVAKSLRATLDGSAVSRGSPTL